MTRFALNPKNADAFNNRGNAYTSKQNYERALEDFTQAIRINPKLALAYITRAFVLTQIGSVDRSIADLNEAIRLDPKRAIAFYNRGVSYRALGDLTRAIADFTQAIRLDPSDPEPYNKRALAYRDLGDMERARADQSAANATGARRQQGERQKFQEAAAQQVATEEERGYKRIMFDDFMLDGKELATNSAKVSIQGIYIKQGDVETLFPSVLAIARARQMLRTDEGIGLLTSDAARSVRKFLLDCRNNPVGASVGCPLTVLGHVSTCTRMTLVGSTDVPCLIVEDGTGAPFR
jgi:tetratricopeptide (TPR) repeat protein